MLIKPEHRRLLVVESVINAAFSAAFAGGFTWWLFGSEPIATPLDRDRLAFDFLPQTFMTVLFSYIFSGTSARFRLRRGQFQKSPTALGIANRIPFVGQALVAAAMVMLTIGVGAWLLTSRLLELPAAMSGVMAMKIVYGSALSVPVTIFSIIAALSTRPQSG